MILQGDGSRIAVFSRCERIINPDASAIKLYKGDLYISSKSTG